MKTFLLSSLFFALTFVSFGEEVDEAVIEGVLIERPDGSFLEFLLVESKIQCNFYNEKKSPIDPDVDRIAVRMERTQPRVRKVLAVAVPEAGEPGLRSPIFVQLPHLFRAYLSLMRDGIDDPVEFYLIYYPQDLTASEPIKIFEPES